jgi:hypothetical protein
VSLTSFNEWGEGTQIEPCQPWTDPDTGAAYKDYGAAGPWLYLNITQQQASSFIQMWHNRQEGLQQQTQAQQQQAAAGSTARVLPEQSLQGAEKRLEEGSSVSDAANDRAEL